MEKNTTQEWYSVHVPSGLATKIARAAHRRGMTPGEFMAYAVSLVAVKPDRQSFRISPVEPRLGKPITIDGPHADFGVLTGH